MRFLNIVYCLPKKNILYIVCDNNLYGSFLSFANKKNKQKLQWLFSNVHQDGCWLVVLFSKLISIGHMFCPKKNCTMKEKRKYYIFLSFVQKADSQVLHRKRSCIKHHYVGGYQPVLMLLRKGYIDCVGTLCETKWGVYMLIKKLFSRYHLWSL